VKKKRLLEKVYKNPINPKKVHLQVGFESGFYFFFWVFFFWAATTTMAGNDKMKLQQ